MYNLSHGEVGDRCTVRGTRCREPEVSSLKIFSGEQVYQVLGVLGDRWTGLKTHEIPGALGGMYTWLRVNQVTATLKYRRTGFQVY